MADENQILTPEFILLLLLLLITLGMWLQLALLLTRLSSRLARLEARAPQLRLERVGLPLEPLPLLPALRLAHIRRPLVERDCHLGTP